MVTVSGAKVRPSTHDQLRALNEPIPIKVVITATGNLRSIAHRGQQHMIRRIVDTWVMEDEWWRQLTVRQYYLVQTDAGARFTIFRDCVANTWYRQHYPYPSGDE